MNKLIKAKQFINKMSLSCKMNLSYKIKLFNLKKMKFFIITMKLSKVKMNKLIKAKQFINKMSLSCKMNLSYKI